MERLSPQPYHASISRQTSRHKSAHADVLASVAFRPRWLTPCSTKLLSVTYCASARNAKKHEKSEELCTINILDEERQRSGACVRHQTPTCHTQVCVLTFAGRAVAVDDSCEQTAVACPSSFVRHGKPWRSPFEGWLRAKSCAPSASWIETRRAARLLCSLLTPIPQRRGLRLVPRKLSHLRRQLRSPCQRVSQGRVFPGGRPLSAGSSARDTKESCFHRLARHVA